MTSSGNVKNTYVGTRYLPYFFTEYGAMMLFGFQKSEITAKINVSIINTFVNLKKYISNESLELKYINNIVFKLDERVSPLENTFSTFDTFSNELFFERQIYDAHTLFLDILIS